MFYKSGAVLNVILRIFGDYEWRWSWRTGSISSMLLLTVRDRPGFCLSETVPSALNLSTIRWIERGDCWFIFPAYLANTFCVLTTEQLISKQISTIRIRLIIDKSSILSEGEEKYCYAIKFIAIFRIYHTKQIT